MLSVSKRLAHLKEKLINDNMYFEQVIKVIFYNLQNYFLFSTSDKVPKSTDEFL